MAESRLVRRALALLLLLVADPLEADVLVPKRGKRIEGAIVSQNEHEVVFNIYFSQHPGVTNPDHVVRMPLDAIKKVEATPRAEVEFQLRLAAVPANDAAGFAAVAAYAAEHRLDAEAKMAHALALAADPTHAAALSALGGAAAWERMKRGTLALDATLREKAAAWLRADDADAREALAGELDALGWAWTPAERARAWRSSRLPLGLREDVPLSWNAPTHPSAVYTIFVPKTYTPLRAWPLVIGLHGGGPGGKAHDEVVGSGPSAMMFYRELAERRGFIVVCPTALVAGWGAPANEELVRDSMREAALLYAIDLDRIYLTGHSMGGYGTWALAPRLAEDLAAVSPMAGAGGGAIATLVKTNTPIFIFHSADDFVDVSSDRAAAKQLKDSGLDFIYTELPDQGHGFPESIRNDLFDFFEPRRRHDKRRKDAWPRHSFLGKVSPEERRFLGDPTSLVVGTAPTLEERLDELALGGGCARRAAEALDRERPPDLAKSLAKLLEAKKAPPSARSEAAILLGRLGADGQGASALGKALLAAPSRDESVVVRGAAEAIAALGHIDRLDTIEKSLALWSGFYATKVSAGTVDFADWERVVPVLVALVEAWARVAPDGAKATAIERHVVTAVFAAKHDISTSDRVPQIPSLLRTALAAATGRAYKKAGMDDAAWQALNDALAGDAAAQGAAR